MHDHSQKTTNTLNIVRRGQSKRPIIKPKLMSVEKERKEKLVSRKAAETPELRLLNSNRYVKMYNYTTTSQ